MHKLGVVLFSRREQRIEFHERRSADPRLRLRDRFVEFLSPNYYELFEIGVGKLHPAKGTRADGGKKDTQTGTGCRDDAWWVMRREAFPFNNMKCG